MFYYIISASCFTAKFPEKNDGTKKSSKTGKDQKTLTKDCFN